MKWRRRPFLWASWAPWPLKVLALGVLPVVFLVDVALQVMRPSWVSLGSAVFMAGTWLACVDMQHDAWRLDQEIQRRRREL